MDGLLTKRKLCLYIGNGFCRVILDLCKCCSKMFAKSNGLICLSKKNPHHSIIFTYIPNQKCYSRISVKQTPSVKKFLSILQRYPLCRLLFNRFHFSLHKSVPRANCPCLFQIYSTLFHYTIPIQLLWFIPQSFFIVSWKFYFEEVYIFWTSIDFVIFVLFKR